MLDIRGGSCFSPDFEIKAVRLGLPRNSLMEVYMIVQISKEQLDYMVSLGIPADWLPNAAEPDVAAIPIQHNVPSRLPAANGFRSFWQRIPEQLIGNARPLQWVKRAFRLNEV